MSDPVEFPVPPDDLRFIRRAERSRSPPPPPQSRDPPAQSPASVAAGRILWAYITGSRRPQMPPAKKAPVRQWPGRVVAVACVLLAATLIPLELIYFLTCRPELHGRRLRARLVTPRDVKRVVFLRSLPAMTLLNRFRL